MLQERTQRDVEDVGVAAVLRCELGRTVHLEHDVAAVGHREEIDARQVEAERDRCRNGQLARPRRRIDGAARAAQRDVRPPLTRRRDPLDRADGQSAGDDHPKIAAGGRHELLDNAASRPEPGPLPELFQREREVALVRAEHDIAAPAAEARLQDERERQRRLFGAAGEGHRSRVRQARIGEPTRRRKLVVRSPQSGCRVQHADAFSLEHAKLPKARLDASQVLADIQARKSDVTASENIDRILRPKDARSDPPRSKRPDERPRRRRLPLRDYGIGEPRRPHAAKASPVSNHPWVTDP